MEYNIYCDESCHLEHDSIKPMVLGAIYAPKEEIDRISKNIRKIKAEHKVNPFMEIKWTKVSKGQIDLYKSLIEYFFSEEHLHFRVLVIPDKTQLDHTRFNQTHDDFYYKMYFEMLKIILDPNSSYNIYLDIKDTKSQKKIEKLHTYLCNVKYDFNRNIINKIQHVRSHEIEIIQIVDLLIGAISYNFRDLKTSEAKLELIKVIKNMSQYSLNISNLVQEKKFNYFIWNPR